MNLDSFKSFMDLLVSEFRLSRIGELYSAGENGGFTGVISFNESHLSIHTWPEFNYMTFDAFLTGRGSDQRPTILGLYQSVKAYFGASVMFEQFIAR